MHSTALYQVLHSLPLNTIMQIRIAKLLSFAVVSELNSIWLQVLRVLDMSKTDGDARYGQQEAARHAKALIEKHLGGVLGNHRNEELEISKSSR